MGTPAQDRQGQAHRQRAEQAALAKIAERIASQFPELSAEEIDRAIQGRYAAFTDSPIRDFVPVLVERQVKRDLATD
jgi:hypothetical protein